MMYKYFSQKELTCKCGCGKAEMDEEFMEKIEELREELDFPFPVTSAYRCPKHNMKVSTTGANGPHTTGKAMDIAVQGERAYQLLKAALEKGFTGVGVAQKGTSRFIHLDTIEDSVKRPRVWSY